MKKSGAELIIEGLKAEGVDHIFGLSGSSVLSILDVLYHTKEISYIQSQHEQGAIYMANGYARSARRAAVCLVSPGAGVCNALPGVAQAFYTFTPTILLAAEETTRTRDLGATAAHPLDAVALFKPITRLALRVERTEKIIDSIRTAFRTALSGKRGPVYLGFPRDILSEQADFDPVEPRRYRVEKPPQASSQDISQAAELLVAAQNPVALADGQVAWAKAEGALLELAELLAMPVAVNEGNKGLIPEDHPLALGIAGTPISPPAYSVLQKADVLLMLGCTLSDATTAGYGYKVIPKDARIIQVDADPGEIGKLYPAELGIVADPGGVVRDLLSEIKERRTDRRPVEVVPRVKDWLQRKKEWEESLMPLRNSDKVPIQRLRLLHDLRKVLPRDAIVSAGSGGTHGWFEYAFPAYAHTTYAYASSWRVLGCQMGEALGAKVALPERLVVCIVSDGSLMMSIQEMATAVAYKLPVLFVICHNSLFGNMHNTQLRRFGGRSIGTELPLPNLANLARDFGAYAERVEKPEEIIPSVKRALESGKPAFLDVIIDSSPENLSHPSALRER